MMDLKSLAEHLDEMPVYPYFTYSQMIVCTLDVRSDLGASELLAERFPIQLSMLAPKLKY
jgi:hypothetical protein